MLFMRLSLARRELSRPCLHRLAFFPYRDRITGKRRITEQKSCLIRSKPYNRAESVHGSQEKSTQAEDDSVRKLSRSERRRYPRNVNGVSSSL